MRSLRLAILVLSATLLALAVAERGYVRSVVAALRTPEGFVAFADARVRYGPGAAELARMVARHLDAAIAAVEQRQFRAFPRRVRVYVCGTVECFRRYTGSARPSGTVLAGRLFLAPRLAHEPGRVPGLLTHELSHLLLAQHLGLFRTARLPSWFMEGLAVDVSGGAGAERVAAAKAVAAIREGRHFDPDDTGSLFFRHTASDYGLAPHLFYRQAGLFVAHLRERHRADFRRLLQRVYSGEPFAEAYRAAFGSSPAAQWAEFTASLQTRP